MNDSAIVRLLNKDDYYAAAIFLEGITASAYKKDFWLDRFECWWKNNPSMDDAMPRGWIIVQNNGEISGFLGNIPVMYSINGKQTLACFATSWDVAGSF